MVRIQIIRLSILSDPPNAIGLISWNSVKPRGVPAPQPEGETPSGLKYWPRYFNAGHVDV
jgi:hypothetical protein